MDLHDQISFLGPEVLKKSLCLCQRTVTEDCISQQLLLDPDQPTSDTGFHMSTPPEARYKLFHQLNGESNLAWVGTRGKLDSSLSERYFDSDRLGDKVVRALAAETVLPVKEILECGEFFERVRRKMKGETIVDLCCGHGFAGILFAIFKKSVKRVVLIDENQPPSFKATLECLKSVAPWAVEKIEYVQGRIDESQTIPENSAVIGVHACGVLTDKAIDLAIRNRSPVAVMPCCYPKNACQAPSAVSNKLGHELAFDIDRTYQLEKAGYQVSWSEIPSAITPMNRVLTAWQRAL